MEFESEMKVMKDYHHLHLKCNVLLLVDVSENFRNNSLKNYGLLPCHYLWGPGISWDTTLNITKIEFELMQDPDRFISFEKDMRVEFLIFVIYIMAKLTVSIQNLITKNKNQSILYT